MLFIGLIVMMLIIALVLGLNLLGVYNRLVALNQNVDRSWSDIDVALKQRHDELGKLIAVCDGYKNFERSTLEAVIKARSAYATAVSPSDKVQAASAVSGAIGRLFAVAEAYPDLKTSQNFIQLQQRVSALEDRIAGQREAYNAAATALNIHIQQFPGAIVAPYLHLQPRAMFTIPDEDKEDVKISFS